MLKSLKFGISITVLLVSVWLVLRALDAPGRLRAGIAWTLVVTLVVEMVVIAGQALRSRPSHFNTSTPLDAALWQVMGAAILIALGALLVLAIVATTYPLRLDPLVATAVRVGLWVLLLVAVSGMAMGGKSSHSVAPNGDLRVPHFFALHALQVLPVTALILQRLPLREGVRWALLITACVVWTGIAVGTLVQALAGRAVTGA